MKPRGLAAIAITVLWTMALKTPSCLADGQPTIRLAAITPTNDWCDLYSEATTLSGQPVPVGTVIDAWDPQGVHCGTYTVTVAGQWGLMHVYGDYGLTTSVDEGATTGDTIRLTVDGVDSAVVSGDPTWSSKGLEEVTLQAPIGPTVAFSHAVSAGWNLVSFNVSPISGTLPITRVQDVLASVAGAYDLVERYEGCDPADPWKVFNAAAPPEGSDLRELGPGQGFWLHMLTEATWTLQGTPMANPSVPLCAGWNMVGWPLLSAQALPAALNSIAGQYASVWGYAGELADPPWRRYVPQAAPWTNSLEHMEPGSGYWIDVTDDCTLTTAFSRALSVGWNLVSFNVNPISGTLPITRVQDVLASVAGAYGLVERYEGCDPADPWKVFNAAAPPEGNDLLELLPGQGFWLHMLTEATWTLQGTPITNLSIALCTGWNMVGWPLSSARALPTALDSVAGQYQSVWGYAGELADPPWRRYVPQAAPWTNSLVQLEPGGGYWIDVTEDCTLLLAE